MFGFNNPDPSPDSPKYGYGFWLELESDEAPDESAQVKLFAVGRHAVTRCTGVASITETWARLRQWVGENNRE